MAVSFFVLFGVGLPQLSGAGPLQDYKDQKHTDRDKVTKKTCPEKFIERCAAQCKPDDRACVASCKVEAPEFCKDRQRRKTVKTIEVAGKAASVGAGAAAVAIQNTIIRKRRKNAAEDGVAPIEREPNPYAIHWNRPSFVSELGGGYLAGGIGSGTGMIALRGGFLGLSGMNSTFSDGEDWLSETDIGPTLFIASPNIIFGLQPSVLISAGNGVQTELGAGARSYTSVHLNQLVFFFDPMLGVINGQWNYHLRIGAGWRVTPTVYVRASYDYRDILDLTDLDISQASLQGVFVTLGLRFN